MTDKYILDGKTPVPVNNLAKWGEWFETANRAVAKTTIGDLEISTVFLGLDHNFNPPGLGHDNTPILFETMVFGSNGEVGNYTQRYSTWEQAETGHNTLVARLRRAILRL